MTLQETAETILTPCNMAMYIGPIKYDELQALATAYLEAAKTVKWVSDDYFNAGELGPHTVERLRIATESLEVGAAQ
jgi:hypothetical protein